MHRLLPFAAPAAALLALFAAARPAVAQAGGALASQTLDPYRFLFIAYALAWIMVLGWVISVARRLARLERRLGDE